MQQEIVYVDVLHELLATMVVEDPERTTLGRASGHVDRVKRRRQGADVIGAGSFDIADHVHAHRLQPRQRNVRLNVPKLAAEGGLENVLHIPKTATIYFDRSYLGQRHPSLPIAYALQPLRDAAPGVNADASPRAQYVIGPDRHVHRQLVEVAGSVAEHVCTEAVEHGRTLRIL